MAGIKKLNSIITAIFKVKEGEINEALSPEALPDWDSFNYLMFISEIEKSFGIKFSMDEVVGAKNLGDIKKFLEEKGVKL